MSAHETLSGKPVMEGGGFTLKAGQGSASMGMECPHQNGLLYMVPGIAAGCARTRYVRRTC